MTAWMVQERGLKFVNFRGSNSLWCTFQSL